MRIAEGVGVPMFYRRIRYIYAHGYTGAAGMVQRFRQSVTSRIVSVDVMPRDDDAVSRLN